MHHDRPTPTGPAQAPGAAVTPDAGILVELAAGLASVDDLGPLLARFLDPIIRLAGAQAGAVRVLSDAGDQLQLISERGLPAGLCGDAPAVGRHCGHCGRAADGVELVWATDLSGCSARSGRGFFGQACRGLLAVPLRHRDRLLGVYNLFFAAGTQPGPEVMAVLRSIGELLGLALNNARLEKDTLRATLMHERQAMAAEVHDSLAQSLAFMKMRMPLLQDAILAHDEAQALRYCDELRGEVSQAHGSLRGILTHFRAPMDPQGLVHALGTSADNFRRSSGTTLEFVNELPGLQLAPEQEAQVLHIVQEALTNVARHAGAQHARLHIAPHQSDDIQVLVEDDGAGLPLVSAERGHYGHYGLEIMLERARRLGGSLDIGTRPGGGTRVRLSFPRVRGTAAGAPPWAASAAGAR
jgi:two-component system, NarL family, nitrate/nitrite sensor histidine kinase NarX